jgi:hypothetical protein
MNQQRIKWFIVGAVLLIIGGVIVPNFAQAKSSFLSAMMSQYPQAANSKLNSCVTCHPGDNPNQFNNYANDYRNSGHNFSAIEQLDSDGDGVINLDEINAQTYPGDASDTPAPANVPVTGVTISGSTQVVTNTNYTMKANITPANATLPINYVWTPEPVAGQGTAEATYRWSQIGSQSVNVTVSNVSGNAVAPTHAVEVVESGTMHYTYLPGIFKSAPVANSGGDTGGSCEVNCDDVDDGVDDDVDDGVDDDVDDGIDDDVDDGIDDDVDDGIDDDVDDGIVDDVED